MIKDKRLTNIIEILQDFKEGNFGTPVEVDGFGEYYEILSDLEAIRRNVLVLQNRESELIEQNKTTIANITHDMKTPLALISGYAESMQCGMDDKDYLDLILQKTAYLNELVLKIISSSRKEIEEIAELKECISARDFFEAEFNSYTNLAETKKIKLIVKQVPDVQLFIDTKEYKSVVQNLITNAIKYGRYGGKITVNFYKNDNYLQIKVRDNGIGIAKENIPKIFDKFYMVDSARSTANSGLGLSIVKKIVEYNGGTITCKSKLNSYTQFTFTIPIYKEKEEKTRMQEALPKIENRMIEVVAKIKNKTIAEFFKKTLLVAFVVFHILLSVLAEVFLSVVLVGVWALNIALLLSSILHFIFMGIVIANQALVPIILTFFGMSIFSLGFFCVLTSEIPKTTSSIILKIVAIAEHIVHIVQNVYGGAK